MSGLLGNPTLPIKKKTPPTPQKKGKKKDQPLSQILGVSIKTLTPHIKTVSLFQIYGFIPIVEGFVWNTELAEIL
jgi:hypothetical protein